MSARLTELEREILDKLGEVANAFTLLPAQHSADQAEFFAAIHRAQDLIGVRVARRAEPVVWNTAEPGWSTP